jgi:chemotaxis protein CheZ
MPAADLANAETLPVIPDSAAFTEWLGARIAEAIQSSVGDQLAEMRRFVDRRFAELSAEINASASIAEMSEATLIDRISRVQHEVARLVSMPVTETRNTGLELEAVVQGTEVAANQILEAAEAISDWLRKGAGTEQAAEISHQVETIFEACSFQDLTSQRIRRAINHLEQVDVMLNTLASGAMPAELPAPSDPAAAGADLGQDMIDKLLN